MAYLFPPPQDWQAFERLCCELWKREWNDPNAQLHGRSGQKDHGVDVFGQTADGWVGVQCKQKAFGRQLTEKLIREEIQAAEKFHPPLVGLTLATTAERDQPIQEFVRRVSEEQVAAGKFRVRVASWGEINDLLNKYTDIARRFYPSLVEPSAAPRFLPFPPLGQLFHGRDTLLEALAQDNDPTAIVQHETIYGLGGIGKTRLAVEFAWRYGDQYPGGVFFVSAESPESLSVDLAKLAASDVLNLPEHQAPHEESTFAAVLRWLHAHDQWLLILDNVDSKESAVAVKELLPRLSKGRVLITSRRSVWPKGIRKQALGVLDPDDARRYLLTATEERTPAADDEERATVLAEALGYLPLALEQAAAYIERHRLGFESYEGLWQAEREKVLIWHDESSSYPVAVAATWQRTFEVLSPGAQTFLRIAALLAPEPIPEWVFLECGTALDAAHKSVLEEHGRADEAADRRAALAELAEYSMADWRYGALTMHRMVQEVVRSRLPDRRQWVEWALGGVNAVTVGDPQDVRSWPMWDPLRTHVEVIIQRGDEEGISEPTSRLMNELGMFLLQKSLFQQAEPLMRRALAIDGGAFGENHPRVARNLNNLALLLYETSRLAEAEPLMKQVVEICEVSFGKEHPKVAIALNNLAQLLKTTNRLVEAEPLMRRALSIDEASLGQDHPKVAIDLSNLALLLQATNRLAEAEPLMRRALSINEAFFGRDHPNVARDFNNLASFLNETNRLVEAESLMRRALSINEACFGEDHPNIARPLSSLALLLQKTNRLAEAEPMMRRALSIDEASFGGDHPNVAKDLNNLASLLQATNRLVEAEPLMRRALSIDEVSLGEDHPKVARDLNNLALLLQATNRLAEAEPMMHRALAITEASLGKGHPSVGFRLGNLARMEFEKGQLDEAEDLVRRAIKIHETSLGPEHPYTLTGQSILADVLAAKAEDT